MNTYQFTPQKLPKQMIGSSAVEKMLVLDERSTEYVSLHRAFLKVLQKVTPSTRSVPDLNLMNARKAISAAQQSALITYPRLSTLRSVDMTGAMFCGNEEGGIRTNTQMKSLLTVLSCWPVYQVI